ncbi:hypothetical protein CONPUDRAFT_142661 [Coniophora puteana RWD-64-598 SS2]|uniref:Uncharacterized protein n=1 Tax=Coniophora puteana (strain RWD-64-598) TaxID=741705 RepID=A0A5M3N0A1_CONPW|nr:uncharacterized protein CONPUDRAFT_142661 [Coniophora puteana RWD-64-598 SS2]EIW84335.1 hypothetical protein CONPUDRAFT_142661 [Coniophora puteana RWD-64-598 SS2]
MQADSSSSTPSVAFSHANATAARQGVNDVLELLRSMNLTDDVKLQVAGCLNNEVSTDTHLARTPDSLPDLIEYHGSPISLSDGSIDEGTLDDAVSDAEGLEAPPDSTTDEESPVAGIAATTVLHAAAPAPVAAVAPAPVAAVAPAPVAAVSPAPAALQFLLAPPLPTPESVAALEAGLVPSLEPGSTPGIAADGLPMLSPTLAELVMPQWGGKRIAPGVVIPAGLLPAGHREVYLPEGVLVIPGNDVPAPYYVVTVGRLVGLIASWSRAAPLVNGVHCVTFHRIDNLAFGLQLVAGAVRSGTGIMMP